MSESRKRRRTAFPGVEIVKESTPDWEKLLYTPERKEAFRRK